MIEPFWSALNTPVLMPNDPVVAFAATVTDAGTVKALVEKLEARVTIAPPWGAGPDRVTVQLPLPLEPSVVGVHCREEMLPGFPSERDTLWEDPL